MSNERMSEYAEQVERRLDAAADRMGVELETLREELDEDFDYVARALRRAEVDLDIYRLRRRRRR